MYSRVEKQCYRSEPTWPVMLQPVRSVLPGGPCLRWMRFSCSRLVCSQRVTVWLGPFFRGKAPWRPQLWGECLPGLSSGSCSGLNRAIHPLAPPVDIKVVEDWPSGIGVEGQQASAQTRTHTMPEGPQPPPPPFSSSTPPSREGGIKEPPWPFGNGWSQEVVLRNDPWTDSLRITWEFI